MALPHCWSPTVRSSPGYVPFVPGTSQQCRYFKGCQVSGWAVRQETEKVPWGLEDDNTENEFREHETAKYEQARDGVDNRQLKKTNGGETGYWLVHRSGNTGFCTKNIVSEWMNFFHKIILKWSKQSLRLRRKEAIAWLPQNTFLLRDLRIRGIS